MGFTDTMVQSVFKATSGDAAAISRDARGYSVSRWTRTQVLKGVTAGAAAAIIPGNVITIPADLWYAMRLMHRTATGICAIQLGHADDDTFAGVLAVWSGSVVLSSTLAAQIGLKAMAKAAARAGGAQGVKIAIKAMSTATGIILNSQLAPKVATSVGTKLAAKVGVRTFSRLIPVISVIVGGVSNGWLLNSMANAAEHYTTFIQANSRA
jgi:hypothetical protein